MTRDMIKWCKGVWTMPAKKHKEEAQSQTEAITIDQQSLEEDCAIDVVGPLPRTK